MADLTKTRREIEKLQLPMTLERKKSSKKITTYKITRGSLQGINVEDMRQGKI